VDFYYLEAMFYLKNTPKKSLHYKSKELDDIYYYERACDGRFRYFTGEKVRVCDWVGERVNKKVSGSEKINQCLDQIEERFTDLIRSFKPQKPSIADFKKVLESKPVIKKTLLQYFDEFITESENRISEITNRKLSPNTIKQYRTCKKNLETYFKALGRELDIEEIDKKFYNDYRTYTIGKNFAPSYFGTQIKNIKVFLAWCDELGVKVFDKYHKFKVPQANGSAQPLKEDEVLMFENLKIEDKALAKVRDKLLSLIYTGTRISDNNLLKDSNIIADRIVYRSVKTNGLAEVPFFDDVLFKPVALYQRCKQDGFMFPVLSDPYFNRELKNLAKLAEFTRIELTSKVGRKTFATIKVLKGVNPHIVMKSTGHTTYKAFKDYLGFDPEDIMKEYKDKASYLKVS
jgi:integrase